MSSNPFNPFEAALNWQRKTLENMTDAAETSQIADERLELMESVEVGQTPSDVVYEENKLELLHYDAEAAGIEVAEEDKEAVPILIVYALINRPYILDLQEERSVVRRCLRQATTCTSSTGTSRRGSTSTSPSTTTSTATWTTASTWSANVPVRTRSTSSATVWAARCR